MNTGSHIPKRAEPQAGEELGLEEECPAFAATVEEPRKERTPRLDWAGLLRRRFALDVFACLRCGGRLKGLGIREGSRRGESKLLALAQEQGVLQHVPRVKLFKTDRPAFDFLSFEEAEHLINAAEPEWRTLILVALKTGLRLGELIGVQWADLDLQRGKLNVRRTTRRGVVGLPKGGWERTVDLPASAVEALKAHRHLCGPYVFC